MLFGCCDVVDFGDDRDVVGWVVVCKLGFFVPHNYRTASLLRYGFAQILEPSIFGGIFTEFGQIKAVLAVFLPYLAKFKGFLTNNHNNR